MCAQNNGFNQHYVMSLAVKQVKLCIRSFLTKGGYCGCSVMCIILVKGVGKTNSKGVKCVTPQFYF